MKLKDRLKYIGQKVDQMMDEFGQKIQMVLSYFEEKYKLEEKRKKGKWYAMSFNEMGEKLKQKKKKK